MQGDFFCMFLFVVVQDNSANSGYSGIRHTYSSAECLPNRSGSSHVYAAYYVYVLELQAACSVPLARLTILVCSISLLVCMLFCCR